MVFRHSSHERNYALLSEPPGGLEEVLKWLKFRKQYPKISLLHQGLVLNFFRKKEIFFKNKFGRKLKPQGRANYFLNFTLLFGSWKTVLKKSERTSAQWLSLNVRSQFRTSFLREIWEFFQKEPHSRPRPEGMKRASAKSWVWSRLLLVPQKVMSGQEGEGMPNHHVRVAWKRPWVELPEVEANRRIGAYSPSSLPALHLLLFPHSVSSLPFLISSSPFTNGVKKMKVFICSVMSNFAS